MVDAPINVSKKPKRKRKAKSKSESAEQEKHEPSIPDGGESLEGVEPAKKKPKKKKKTEEQSTDLPESKMSKRQLKRERHAQRMAEAEAAAHKAVQMQALSYLSLWKYNKAEWKFNKVKQIWLHKHKFDSSKVPDELWQPFIEYFSSASGGIKQAIVGDCQKIIEEMENWIEKNKDAEMKEKKPSDVAYQRARDLLQNINS